MQELNGSSSKKGHGFFNFLDYRVAYGRLKKDCPTTITGEI